MVFIPRRPTWLTALSHEQVQRVQRQLNDFTGKHLKGVVPLVVDGKVGKHTRDRVVMCKFWLGYAGKRNAQVKRRLMRQLARPNWKTRFPRGWGKVGRERRAAERQRYEEHHAHAVALHGTATYDGKVVAAYWKPILDWCRHVGHNGERWQGVVVSGYRTPEYSEHLCYVMCGAPACAGRCAGRNTNHAWLEPPRGAVDVTDYVRFGRVVAHCPYLPHVLNDLPIDRVHYSPTGR